MNEIADPSFGRVVIFRRPVLFLNHVHVSPSYTFHRHTMKNSNHFSRRPSLRLHMQRLFKIHAYNPTVSCKNTCVKCVLNVCGHNCTVLFCRFSRDFLFAFVSIRILYSQILSETEEPKRSNETEV